MRNALIYISDFSKYFIVAFAFLYVVICYVSFSIRNKNVLGKLYFFQYMLIIAFHISCMSPIYMHEERFEVMFYFLIQLLVLYVYTAVYHMLYQSENRLLVNNVCFLMTTGFVILIRLSYGKAVRQLFIVIIACALAILVPYIIRRMGLDHTFCYVFAAVGILALGAVLLYGAVSHGSKLSFTILGVSFQPSEFVKIIYVLSISGILAKSESFFHILISGIVAAIHVILLVLSRDLGSALIYFITYVLLVFVSSGKLRYLVLGAGLGAMASAVAYRLFTHVRVRVMAWKDPFSVIDREGFQIAQSLFAISVGGFFGLGLYRGSPSSIPFVETDFIFSAITEEMGILFSLCILLIYLSSFISMILTAISMWDIFSRFAVLGLAVMFIFQVFLTVGGGVKFIPLTGVTLPLVSYGGSSIIGTMLLFAVVQGLKMQDDNY